MENLGAKITFESNALQEAQNVAALNNQLKETGSLRSSMGTSSAPGVTMGGDMAGMISGSGGSGGSGIPSSMTSPLASSPARKMEETLKKLTNDPALRKAAENFQDLIQGFDQAGTERLKREYTKRIGSAASSFVGTYHSSRSQVVSEAQRQGISKEVALKEFDDKWMGSLEEAAKNLPDLGKENGKVQHQMRNVGRYIIAGIVAKIVYDAGQYIQSSMMTTATNVQQTGLGFNATSLLGHSIISSETAMEVKMRELQLQKQGYEAIGGTVGAGLGFAIGSIGGPVGAPIGAMVGGALGMEIGGIFGTKDIAEEMEAQTTKKAWNKLKSELYPAGEERVRAWENYDRSRTMFGARYGGRGPEGQGLGYASDELYGLMYQSGQTTGKYDSNTFMSQLAFSRAYGYNPQEVMQSNISARYTGEEVQAGNLESRRGLASLTGMGTRFGDLVQSMNQLAMVMTKSGVSTSERGLLETSLLPFMLYGDTAKGRMGDLGMNTIQGMNSMFQQADDSAGNAFLWSALGKGKSIREFEIAKQKGAYDPGNLETVLRTVQKDGGKGDRGFHMLMGLGLDANLADTVMKKAINYKGDKSKGEMDGIDGFVAKMKEELAGLDPEEQKKKLGDLVGLGKEHTSQADKHHAALKDTMIKTGDKIHGVIYKVQLLNEEMLKNTLTNKEFWNQFIVDMQKAFKDIGKVIKELMEKVVKDEQKKAAGNAWGDLVYNWATYHDNTMEGGDEQKRKEKWAMFVERMRSGMKDGTVKQVKSDTADRRGEGYLYFPDKKGGFYELSPDFEISPGIKSKDFPVKLDNAELKDFWERQYFGHVRNKADVNYPGQVPVYEGWAEGMSGRDHPSASKGGQVYNFLINIDIDPNELDRGLQVVKDKIQAELAKTSVPRRVRG